MATKTVSYITTISLKCLYSETYDHQKLHHYANWCMNCNNERKSEVQRNDVNVIMDKLAIQYCTDNIRYFPYFEQFLEPAHIWF